MATPEETLRDAARRMSQHNVGTLVVVDAEFHPTGILTDRDITLRCVAPGKDPDKLHIAEAMTTPARSVFENTAIDDALGIMKRAGVRRLPVTDAQGVLVGLVALDDVLDLIADETSEIGSLLRREAPAIG
jgi:CBS domain-containing protein